MTLLAIGTLVAWLAVFAGAARGGGTTAGPHTLLAVVFSITLAIAELA